MSAPITTRAVFRGMLAAVHGVAQVLAGPHGVDRYLELVDPMLAIGEVRGAVIGVQRRTANTVTLTVRPSRAWRGFQAGQYVRVSVDLDGVRRTRCYSPAASQHHADGVIELTIARHRNGMVSPYLVDNARRGMVLGLSQADGVFTLPKRRPERLLLISGGSGITPVMSMLRTLRDERYTGQLTFLHYARTPSDVPYLDELTALRALDPNPRVVLAYTRSDSGDLSGHLTRAHLTAAAPWYPDADTYVCGPPGLIGTVRDLFAADGSGERVRSEEFTPTSGATEAGPAGGQVFFARSQIRVDNSGKTLLEQAEQAKLKPSYGCRMGVCLTCTRRKTTGRVRDTRTGALRDDLDEEIQLCVSVPIGDVALDL